MPGQGRNLGVAAAHQSLSSLHGSRPARFRSAGSTWITARIWSATPTWYNTPSASVQTAGKPPSSFPERGLRLDYGEDLVSDPNLDAVLEGLLEPLTEDRLPAAEALRLLQAPASEARWMQVSDAESHERTMMFWCRSQDTSLSAAHPLQFSGAPAGDATAGTFHVACH